MPLKTLIDADALRRRVEELGRAIERDYAGRSLVFVVVLRGSFIFAADLCRAVSVPLRIEFLGVESYGDSRETSGVVRITQDLKGPIEGEHVLVVEDIVDTGLTLSYLLQQLRSRAPASVRVCTLLHKPARTRVPVTLDYVGFEIEDRFVVGYGLDDAQRHRNLPYLAVVEPPA